LDLYWRLDGFRPLLIRVRQHLAGFALINTRSRRNSSIEHNMAEFFVARKHRRRGVATEAVRQILAQYRGHWELRWPNAMRRPRRSGRGRSGLRRMSLGSPSFEAT